MTEIHLITHRSSACASSSSQSLSTLTVIEDFLSKRPMPAEVAASSSHHNQTWVRNVNYFSESPNLYCSCKNSS